jgi:hypothetical protein
VVGNSGTQTVSSRFHQKKKSNLVRPRERNGQFTSVEASDPRIAAMSKCGGLKFASCWNRITMRPLRNRHKEFLQHTSVHYSRNAVGKKVTSHTCIVRIWHKNINLGLYCSIHQSTLHITVPTRLIFQRYKYQKIGRRGSQYILL